jgi:hypothetical protein
MGKIAIFPVINSVKNIATSKEQISKRGKIVFYRALILFGYNFTAL